MITAFYLPDFQAWYRARYTRKPTVIIRRDRIVAATSDLRERGVENGESLSRICRQFPGVDFHIDDPAYEAGSRELIMHELNRVSPSASLLYNDFLCVEVPTLKLAQAIAGWLRARAGWAADTFTACVAALDGYIGVVNIVEKGMEAEFIRKSPTASLEHFRIDGETIERLELFGYRTIGGLQGLSRKHLHSQFGAKGIALHDFLHQEPCTTLPIWTPPPVIEACYQFNDRVREPAEWHAILAQLCRQATAMLNGMRTTFSRIVLDDTEKGEPVRYTLPLKRPSSDPRLITERSEWILRNRRYPAFGRMTVVLAGLVQPECVQGSLFEERSELAQARRAILRRFPNGLLQFEEIDPIAPLPEDRWRLATAGA